jgi:hypothetical protein
MFILRASSGYSGGTLNLSLRVLAWDEEDWVACEAAPGIASVFQNRDPIKMENVSFRRRDVWRDELAIITVPL